MALRILVTGGTFDKTYEPFEEALLFERTHIPEMLAHGRCAPVPAVETLMLVDSAHMTEGQRNVIVQRCGNCLEDRIVITHGTSTMLKTAQRLGQQNYGKTIVLTGAMVPRSVENSDATFNFAFALGSALALPRGTYVAMNGRAFSWNKVYKDERSGTFHSLR